MQRKETGLLTASARFAPAPDRDERQLPLRVRHAIDEEQCRAEILIARIQLAIVLVFAAVYAVAPKAFPDTARFMPVPWILSAYAAVTLARLVLAHRGWLKSGLLGIAVALDMALLMLLIWSFHLQYMQPPAFYLKVPTLFTAFIFIALGTLRFKARYVVVAGGVAALGWAVLTGYAVRAGDVPLTHDFAAYITSDSILIGAEVEKILAIVLVTAVLAVAIARERRLLVRAVADSAAWRDLSRFFAPEIAARIRGAERPLTAGTGEVREAAILMVDIRGFTRLSTVLQPDALIALLAEYQARLVPVIVNCGGSIDKFLGDGIMATFGCTRPSKLYAAEALEAVDLLVAEIDRWTAERQSAGQPPLRVNCAVTTGRVVFGAVGDASRLEYTVIGDPVNLAAKVEKQNKVEATRALCPVETYELACAQGYTRRVPPEKRLNRTIAGADSPIDLVVLA
jgi:adenylate cyclase